MTRQAALVRSVSGLELVSWTADAMHFCVAGTEQRIVLDASLQLTTSSTEPPAPDETISHDLTRADLAQLKRALKPRAIEHALHLGERHVLVQTKEGELLDVAWPIADEPQLATVAVETEGFHIVAHGAHWFAHAGDVGYVGRAGRAPQVLHFEKFAGSMTAREQGLVLEQDGAITLVPWQTFEVGCELHVTPVEIAMPGPETHRAKVLLAGATILRVEILDPPAHWKRTTITVPSHGNPLGLGVGDIVVAEGHGRADGFDVTRVRPPVAVATSATATRSTPTLLARLGADRPRWLDALLAAGLIDDDAVVPRHTWFDGAAGALAAIYAPRDAMERGWFRCDWKFWRDTDDPAADLIALAAPSNLEVASVDPTPDEDELRIRSRIEGKRARTKTVELNTISDLVPYLNELLAEAGCARRIYECHTESDWYAFLARTPDEIRSLIAAGFTELVEPDASQPTKIQF